MSFVLEISSKNVSIPNLFANYKNIIMEKKNFFEVKAAMFRYTDGTLCKTLLDYKELQAVVVGVTQTGYYAACLNEKSLSWSSSDLWVGTADEDSGKEATRLIMEQVRKTGRRAEAAEYCFHYAFHGVKQGQAFLPSKKELELCFNPAFENAEKITFPFGVEGIKNYWSATEEKWNNVWHLDALNAPCIPIYKKYRLGVCPFLFFEF